MADFPDFPDFPKKVEIPQVDGKKIAALGALVVVLFGAWTSFYSVPAESQAVVLRFGKHVSTTNPGLRFKLPFGIDKNIIVPVKRQLNEEFGFGDVETEQGRSSWGKNYRREQQEAKSMVTGDRNAALVTWVIQYHILDPKAFLFNVRNPRDTLRDASESVMREVVGDRTVDEVITIGRQEIELEAREKLQALIDKYEMGFGIDQVQLNDVTPPDPVKPSFNDVNTAKQRREELINLANAELNREVPKAKGEADQKIRSAEGYATKRINEAEGDVARFNAMLAEYLKAPEVTKRRIYLETVTKVMPNLGKKIIIDDDAKQILPLLNLSEGGSK